MSEMKSLKDSVKEIRKKNGYFAHLIYFFLALILSAIVLLNMFISSYFWIIFLVVCLPLIFAFERSVLVIREDDEPLTLGLIFRGIKTYFSARFISTYSFFRTLVRTLLWGLLFGVIIFLIMMSVFSSHNILQFNVMVNTLRSMTNLDSNAINAILELYKDCVHYFMNWFMIAFNFVSYLTFFHYINKHSVHLFMETSKYGDDPRYAKYLFRTFLKERRFEFLGKYFSLQYPLYILFIVGVGLGGYLGSLYAFDGVVISTFALALGLLLSIGGYGGFALANKEALFNYFVPSFKKLEEDLHNQAIEEMKRMAEYNAQREAFLKQLQEQWNRQNNQNQIEEKKEEDDSQQE